MKNFKITFNKNRLVYHLKRFTFLSIVVLILVSTFSSIFNAYGYLSQTRVGAENSSGSVESVNERIVNQLKIASGQGDGSLANGDNKLTPAELKTLGFFLSNYYSPFTTKISGKGKPTSATVGKQADDVQKILKDIVGMSDESSKEVAKMITETSKETSKKLYLAVYDPDKKTWNGINREASYFEVLFGSVGLFEQAMNTVEVENDTNNIHLLNRYKGFKKGKSYLGLVTSEHKSDKGIPREAITYEWTPDPDMKPTPSQFIFYSNFKAVGDSSWGSNIFTLDYNDKKIQKALKSERPINALMQLWYSKSKLKRTTDKNYWGDDKRAGTVKTFYDQSIFSADMYVDGFGNLLSTTGTKSYGTYVILPASQNPMYYAKKSSSSSSSEAEKTDEATAEKKEDKKSDKKKKNTNKISSSEDKLKEYFRDKSNGVGCQIPYNNLNTMALVAEGILKMPNTDEALEQSVSVSKRVSVIGGDAGFENFDQSDNSLINYILFSKFSDEGSALKNLIFSQWALRRIPYDKEAVKDAFEGFGNTSFPLYQVTSGKKWLPFSDYDHLGTDTIPALGNSGGWFTRTHGINEAVNFMRAFSAKQGDADIITYKGSQSLKAKGITTLVAFDKYNFASPKISDTSSTIKIAKMSTSDADGDTIFNISNFKSSRISGGKWVGSGKKGALVDTTDVNTDKKYGINVFTSTYLTRANPFDDKIDYVINLEGTPEISVANLDTDSSETPENMDAVLKNMAYYMLNPTTGRQYKKRWGKTFQNAIIVGSLEDMVGANTADTHAGTTNYLELTGFATIPRTNEIKLTAQIYEAFSTWGIFILIVISFLTLIFVFIGQLRVIPAILAVFAFGIMLYMPPKATDSLTNISNSVSGYFFRDKFLFWVLANHQNYEDSLEQLMEAANSGNMDTYSAYLLQLQSGTGSPEATEGESEIYEWQQTLGATVKVRWMSPKKDGYTTQVKRDIFSYNADANEKQNTDKKEDGDKQTNPSSGSYTSSKPNLNDSILIRVLAENSESSSNSSDTSSSSTSGSEGEKEEREDNSTDPEAYKKGLGGITDSLIAQGLSNEDFTGLDTNYLYRGYTDISDYSRFYYGNIMGDSVVPNGGAVFNIGSWEESLSLMFPDTVSDNKAVNSASNSVTAERTEKAMKTYLNNSSSSNDDDSSLQNLIERDNLGFINDYQEGINEGQVHTKTVKRAYAPISSNTVSKITRQDISKLKVGDSVGLDSNLFILSTNNFNNHSSSLKEQMAKANEGHGNQTLNTEDATSLSTFALYTESPFYYFSWGIYDQGLSTKSGSTGKFKELMLDKNDGYFYNYKIKEGEAGFGAGKDYLDFGTLFNVVIPYLRESNKTLLQWSDIYGTVPYNGYGSSQDDLNAVSDKGSEAYYKTWFNVSADNAYRTYSAWVDALYDLDIAKPETIEYAGVSQRVSEPLNPASYKIRPMVFSESERLYYGIDEAQLTKVEQKLLKINKDVRNDWLPLMNYYTMDDVVLNTSMSMLATFAFNREFSQTMPWQEQVVLEPHGFELKAFGWDAYLRMILQSASGESIEYNSTLKSSIYDIIAEKDGTFTIILVWLLSALVVYVIPTMKVTILVLLPIASLLSIFTSFLRQDRKFIRVFSREVLFPFLTVLIVNIGLSLLVAVMMGDGSTLVTGSLGATSNFTSPRGAIGVLILAVSIATAIYGIATWNLWQGLIKNGKTMVIPVKASLSMLASVLTGGVGKLQTAISGAGGRGGAVTPNNDSTPVNGSGYDGVGGSPVNTFPRGTSPAEQSDINMGSSKHNFDIGLGRNGESKKSKKSREADKKAGNAIDEALKFGKKKQTENSEDKPNLEDTQRKERAEKAEKKLDDLFNQ